MLGVCRPEETRTTVLRKIFCEANDSLEISGLPGPPWSDYVLRCHLEVFTQESVQLAQSSLRTLSQEVITIANSARIVFVATIRRQVIRVRH